MLEHAYVSFGSNIGDRVKNFGSVLTEIGVREIHLKRISRLYISNPMEGVTGGLFLNAVFECSCTMPLRKFFETLQKIETALGSQTRKDNKERICDLDLLLWGDSLVHTESLTLPHPRMLERDFILHPLCDLVANEKAPGSKQTFAEHLNQCKMLSVTETIDKSAL
ncbi:MAG: 2-amino-4-hydroxy-6-hydroxymethyldihydropteridine diphosphokinase [Calditrichaeota bacterium]|nr:2-amino-4-hydroxy-6-hydroxymethyldihydropteridine diphosphokinase [Calditrichota bacterium]